jgi:bacterioferritin
LDKEKSIKLLNESVADELQAVHQYMYWHFHLDDQGFESYAKLFKRIAIEEMGHVEMLAERILFLKGDVEMEKQGPIEHITELDKILARAAQMESESADSYNENAKICHDNSDAGSRQVYDTLVSAEERHYDIFDTEKDQLARYGQTYVALQAAEDIGDAG